MSVAQYPGDGGPKRSRRLGVEIGTAVVVAFVVAATVVAVGINRRDGADTGPVAGQTSSPSPAAQSSPPDESEADSEGAEPEETPDDATTPDGEPTEAEEAEVTDVEVTVEPADYTGRCPVTLDFAARITTNTGPVRASYRWLDGDSAVAAEDDVQFGGPGPQGVTVTHEVEVPDDAAVLRAVDVTEPNPVDSDPAEATVTCTPYAEVTKAGDDFIAPECRHELSFEARITVPHDMTVTYEWLRSDGAVDTSGPHTVEFHDGGQQTKEVPGKTWTLSATGDFGYQVHIIEPYDVTSDPATYSSVDCSGPAS